MKKLVFIAGFIMVLFCMIVKSFADDRVAASVKF